MYFSNTFCLSYPKSNQFNFIDFDSYFNQKLAYSCICKESVEIEFGFPGLCNKMITITFNTRKNLIWMGRDLNIYSNHSYLLDKYTQVFKTDHSQRWIICAILTQVVKGYLWSLLTLPGKHLPPLISKINSILFGFVFQSKVSTFIHFQRKRPDEIWIPPDSSNRNSTKNSMGQKETRSPKWTI